MKKVLVLSCSTGEGHNSAAYAVLEELESRGIEGIYQDPVLFKSERAKKLVASAYNQMIKKTPAMFGAVYKIGDWYSNSPLPSPVYHANRLYMAALWEYLEQETFDAVISTHLYGMEVMTAIRRKTNISLPCWGVLTDYTCIPFMAETELDGYFTPHADLTPELVQKGMPANRIYPTGIPVFRSFDQTMSLEQAREILHVPTLKTSIHTPVVTVMTGGVGCGNVNALCEELMEYADQPFLCYILCGRNEKMREQLLEKYGEDGTVRAIGFNRQVDLYMRCADVLITKPGGISSTEAAAVHVPLVHTLCIPGCETKNAAFFSARGMSLRAEGIPDAAKKAWELIHNTAMRARMRQAQRENIRSDASKQIVDIMERGTV